MLWRRGALPEELISQARASVAVAREASRFFRRPSEAGAYAVRQAGLRARREAAALMAGRGLPDGDWLILSRRLAEAAQAQAAAAAEAARFGVGEVAGLAGAGAGLRECGRQVLAALEALPHGPGCAESLVAAKRWALVAQRRHSRARAAALDAPNAVLALKVRTVLRRFDAAAEAWQQAADCIAEVLGSGVK